MAKLLLKYRQVSIDSAHIRGFPEKLQQTFFDPGPYLDGSIRVTELDEKPLVRWMMLFEPARRLLLDALGFPASAFCQPEVKEPFYSANDGDLDLIVCARHAPHEAAAIEFKRVKVTVLDPEHHQLNKLNNVRAGVDQANRLYKKFGFSQTYLTILTATDTCEQEGTNIPCRGIDPSATPDYGETKTLSRIVDFPDRDDLHDDIGIVFFDIVQPSRISIDKRVNLLVCVHQTAERRMQQDSVTNRIEILLAA